MYSFFLHAGSAESSAVTQAAENLFAGHINWIQNPGVSIAFADDSSHFHHEGKDYILIGKADNLNRLNGSEISTQNHAELCYSLIEKSGINTINRWKGCFAFIINDQQTKQLHFTIGNTGLMPAYNVKDDKQIIVTSELKAFRKTDVFERKMMPLDSYQYEYTKHVEQDFCFLQNVKRIIPGYFYTVNYSAALQITSTPLQPVHSAIKLVSAIEAKEEVYKLLEENIQDKMAAKDVAVTVSGGVDSGVIAAMLAKHATKVSTYTIGTDFGDEFDNAKEVHQLISSKHHEIHIDDEEFWKGFTEGIWHNEFCDPLYAEGYVGFYHALQQANTDATQMFTGYGADLILGDFLNIGDRSTINSFSEYWCKRASWTGEMSPYLAQALNMEIIHPFWEIELINYGLSIPFELKYKGDEVKAILREMAEEKKLLTEAIAWRKKNAFTTGASLDKLFSHCLGIPDAKNYRFKSIFLYFIFEAMFVNDQERNAIDLQSLIQKTKLYA